METKEFYKSIQGEPISIESTIEIQVPNNLRSLISDQIKEIKDCKISLTGIVKDRLQKMPDEIKDKAQKNILKDLNDSSFNTKEKILNLKEKLGFKGLLELRAFFCEEVQIQLFELSVPKKLIGNLNKIAEILSSSAGSSELEDKANLFISQDLILKEEFMKANKIAKKNVTFFDNAILIATQKRFAEAINYFVLEVGYIYGQRISVPFEAKTDLQKEYFTAMGFQFSEDSEILKFQFSVLDGRKEIQDLSDIGIISAVWAFHLPESVTGIELPKIVKDLIQFRPFELDKELSHLIEESNGFVLETKTKFSLI